MYTCTQVLFALQSSNPVILPPMWKCFVNSDTTTPTTSLSTDPNHKDAPAAPGIAAIPAQTSLHNKASHERGNSHFVSKGCGGGGVGASGECLQGGGECGAAFVCECGECCMCSEC